MTARDLLRATLRGFDSMNLNPKPRRICAHCTRPMRGYATVGGDYLCHPDVGLDCYRLVTIYDHPMPCQCKHSGGNR